MMHVRSRTLNKSVPGTRNPVRAATGIRPRQAGLAILQAGLLISGALCAIFLFPCAASPRPQTGEKQSPEVNPDRPSGNPEDIFNTDQRDRSRPEAPIIQPWRRVPLDPAYAGAWVVAGDLDQDGAVEIVSARNVDRNDVHYTSAVVAQELDGQVLWRWGDPQVGRRKLHHDVACQIYDWDGDRRNEVVLCAEQHLVELDGATGRERRRLPLPPEATDCLVFANLTGGPRAGDVLVKTRYTQLWAFSHDWKQLWTVALPGGYRTAHQPVPIDLDGDGRDELMAGYAMLNPSGSVRWTVTSEKTDLKRGHLDCCRVVRSGSKPEEVRLALTYCGANCLALVDGAGHTLWEAAGHHFESINVGKIRADRPGLQLVVDIDHRPRGEGPLWVFDEQGRQLGQVMTDYARHHGVLDWTGDGLAEMVVAHARGIFDGHGRRLASLAIDEEPNRTGETAEMLCLLGDFTGDGVPDIALTTPAMTAVHIFKNEQGKKPAHPIPLGTAPNFTLY